MADTPWDDEHEPTREEVATYLHGVAWEALPVRQITDAYGGDMTDHALTVVVQAVLRGLSDVIYQQRRNFPEGDGVSRPANPFQVASDAEVDTLLEEIGDAL